MKLNLKIPELESLKRAFIRALRAFIAGFCGSMSVLIIGTDFTTWQSFKGGILIGSIAGGLQGVSKLLRDDQNLDIKIF